MNLVFIKNDDGYLRVYPGILTEKPRQIFKDPFNEKNYAGDAPLSHCRYIRDIEDCRDIESKLKLQLEDITDKLVSHPHEEYLHSRLKYTKYYINLCNSFYL
jgi:hypothetical protein